MSKYNEELQRFWKVYEQEVGGGSSFNAHEVAAWAFGKGYWKPRSTDVISQLADDLARAWREEYRTDSLGRHYRVKHAVRSKGKDGKQITLWAEIDTAPRPHMEKAFAQRRKQIVGDCVQLKTDVDVFNDIHESEKQVQVVLDFSKDVEEAQSLVHPSRKIA